MAPTRSNSPTRVREDPYYFDEYSQPIKGISKDGAFILGKGKAMDGYYKQKAV